MATKLEDFDFGSEYPWSEWLDGSAWEITTADVAGGSLKRFAGTARTQAKKRGMKLRTRTTVQDNLVIQAYTQ
jgi:hypothetical protein